MKTEKIDRAAAKKLAAEMSSEEFRNRIAGWGVSLDDVIKLTGMSEPTIYRLVKLNEFPKPIEIFPNVQAWPVDRLFLWYDSVIETCREKQLDLIAPAMCSHEKT